MNEELRLRLIAVLSDLVVDPDEYLGRCCIVCGCLPCSGCERQALLMELAKLGELERCE